MPENDHHRPKNRPLRHHRWQDSLKSIMETAAEQPADINVGQRLRELRSERDLSVRALADLCGLNFNTLSLIENGKSSPSVSTLQQIAGALGIPIAAFFETATPQKEILFQQSGHRPKAEFSHGLLEDMGCGMTLGQGAPLLVTLDPGADSGANPITHTGQEFVYCLGGCLHYMVDGQTYELHAGDSLLFEAHLPHRWENHGQTKSHSLLILCPADERDPSAEKHFIAEVAAGPA